MSENQFNESVEYRPVPGFPGYRVGNDGSVWSCWAGRRWHQLRPRTRKGGWLQVQLRRTSHYVHRLILAAFVGPCPEGMQCRHLNGVAGDNRLQNLRWGTYAENHCDKKRHGTLPRGIRCYQAVLTEDDVQAIRRRYASEGVSFAFLARQYGTGTTTIAAIISRRSWRHIA